MLFFEDSSFESSVAEYTIKIYDCGENFDGNHINYYIFEMRDHRFYRSLSPQFNYIYFHFHYCDKSWDYFVSYSSFAMFGRYGEAHDFACSQIS